MLKICVMCIAMAVAALGLWWVAQDFGLIPWPRRGMMRAGMHSAELGAALAAIGIATIWLCRTRHPH